MASPLDSLAARFGGTPVSAPPPPQMRGGAPAEATYAHPTPEPYPGAYASPYIRGPVNLVTGFMQDVGSRLESGTAGMLKPLAEAAVATPGGIRVGNVPRAIDEALRGAVRGVVNKEPPAGLSPQSASYDYLRQLGFDPTSAAVADFVASTPIAWGAGKVVDLAGAPLAREIGRAAEPLRQLPGVRHVGENLSPAFSVPAFRGAENYLPYVAGAAPSERAVVRAGAQEAAGQAALQADTRDQLLRSFKRGVKAAMKNRSMTESEANDFLRSAVNEVNRQGPVVLQGMDPAEMQAVWAARAIPAMETSGRVNVGLRPNELGAHVERRAQIAEARIQQAKDLAAQGNVPLEALQKGRTKATRSAQRFEQASGIGFPRDIQSRRINLEQAGAMLQNRREWPVGYDPRMLSPLGREAEGMSKYGTPRGLSTSLGGQRSTFYHEPTADVEARLLDEAAQKGMVPPARFGDEALGERPRYFQPLEQALEQHGARADRALEHATFLDFMARKFGTTAEKAGPNSGRLGDLPALTGFDKNVRARLENTYLPEGHYRFVKQLSDAMGDKSWSSIEEAARKSLSIWKPLVTITRPEFWIRNWGWSKFIQGAYGNLDPANDRFGLALVQGRNAAQVFRDMPTIGPVTGQQLRREFIRNRIISASRAVDIGTKGALGRAYQTTEDALRASYARYLLRRGKTIDEASAGVRELMFNYGHEAFTPLLNKLREVGFPFLSWSVNIPKLTLRTAGERPQAFARLGMTATDVNRAVGLSPEEEANLGTTFAERGGFAVSQPDASGQVRGMTYSPIGFFDVNQWGPRPYHHGPLPDNLQGQWDNLVTMSHPAFNLGAALTTGRNYLGGYQYPNGPVRLPAWTRILAGRVPWVSLASTGEPIGPWQAAATLQLAGPVPNIPFDAQDPRWGAQMSAVKALTGIPLTRTNIQQNRHYGHLEERRPKMSEHEYEQRRRRLERRLQGEHQ